MCIFILCFSFPLENWRINQLHFGSACFHFLTKPKGFFAVRDKWPRSLLPAFFCRVLIGSPLTGQPAKRTGDVYRCPVGQNKNTGCEKFLLPGERWPSWKHLCVRLAPSCFPQTVFVHCCVSSVCIYCVFLLCGCGYITRKLVIGGVTDITSVGKKLSYFLSWYYFDCPNTAAWLKGTSRFRLINMH